MPPDPGRRLRLEVSVLRLHAPIAVPPGQEIAAVIHVHDPGCSLLILIGARSCVR
jgi:hypothetical protein